MFATLSKPQLAYATVGLETGIASASPHKLILMLFDGALVAISSASRHMQQQQIAEKGSDISRAIDIVTNGLKASLDVDAGGELADKLAALYDYMAGRLLYANLHNSPAALEEVRNLLQDIRGAWEEIADDPAVLSSNKAAA
jgi:flagellar protein FliS